MVPATAAAIPGLPLPAVDSCTPLATPPSSRPGHPLHPMIAVLIAAVFEWVIRGLPAEQ